MEKQNTTETALCHRPDALRFAEFELDLRAGALRRAGQPVSLPPQQFAALLALIEEPGTLVTRDQLRRRLWGDDEHVDFDAGLNFCIRQLRLALGDTATQPRFIQTVPRRGYRFVAEVLPRVGAAVPPRRSTWMMGSAAAALALLVAGGAYWSLASAASTPPISMADARIADAHSAHGFVALNDEWAWDVAERSFNRALQLDPTHEVALISLSRLHASQGRLPSALSYAQRAVDAHPGSLRAQVTLGWTHLFAGNPREAVRVCKAAFNRQPTSASRHCLQQAEAELGIDHGEIWRRQLTEASNTGQFRWYFQRACLEARLGRIAEALRSLQRAIINREPDATFALVHPALRGLRHHQEFRAMTTAAGLDLRKFSSVAH